MTRPRRSKELAVRLQAWVSPSTLAALHEECKVRGCSVGELIDVLVSGKVKSTTSAVVVQEVFGPVVYDSAFNVAEKGSGGL